MNDMNNENVLFNKILIIGMKGVGKTKCILNYVYSNAFPYNHEIAIEDSYRKMSHYIEKFPVIVELFELIEINPISDYNLKYVNESNIVIVMCELYSEESVQYLESTLFPAMEDKIANLPTLIVINDKLNKENHTKKRIKKQNIKSILEKFKIHNYSFIDISTSNYSTIVNLFSHCTTIFAFTFQQNIELVEVILKKDKKLLSKNCVIN
ncbi:predicted protein [Naegleria gruberi]|uniref:Predicted protein n=1 Tax=Naegleria gruberi TaxID=5762 RepID=D2V0P8_NAEGR|nr:uncharacterized protein NAEGRDRAFT_62369 [Naegleria gruberi]EFC49556.1 predicted protein [Naegleria gruberi]|eukprot:XP_002682300.1 predicted protein [Naegleria gruberi strain NEG-M]